MYVIVWEFHVPEKQQEAFERAYGARGDWTRLFAMGEGYAGTELLRDRADPSRYVTIDRWRSQDDFDRFMARFHEPYEVLDRECEELTVDEIKIGAFDRLE